MNNTIKQIMNMKTALWTNAFIFYFKRLWIVGKWMPDSVYWNYEDKRLISIVIFVIRQIFDFIAKPLYLFFFMGLPYLFLEQKSPEFQGQGLYVMVHILFFLSCYIGAFGDNHLLSVTRDKVTLIKYMHMNSRDYAKGSLAFRYIPFFLYYLPCLLGAALFFGQPLWEGFFAWLMFICFRVAGEAFQLFIFDRSGKVVNRNMVYQWGIIITGLFGAYYLPNKGILLPAHILLHPVTALAYVLVGGACIYYITAGYRGYEKKFQHSLDLNFLLSNMLKTSSGAAFKEVEIKDKDLNVTKTSGRKYENLQGYAYLNALFFARHRRQLLRPVYYRLLIVLAVFFGSVFFYRSTPALAVQLSQNLSASLLPSCVFIMYAATVAEKACRAMFYNCDKDMLHYAYYRTPQTILKTFRVRLVRISLLNIAVAFAMCLAAAGFCILCGTSVFTLDVFLFCITLLLLAILFTAHHLCLYYIFQPYSESLKIKNPFFSAINVTMYSLCFLCLQLDVGGPFFTMTVLIFTVFYVMTALVFVYHRAPKSFRVK